MGLGLFVFVVLMALAGMGVLLAIDRNSTSASTTTTVDVFTDAYLATMTEATSLTSLSTTTIIGAPAMLFLSTHFSRNVFQTLLIVSKLKTKKEKLKKSTN